jgi:tryptophanyl-tRNA synthetase
VPVGVDQVPHVELTREVRAPLQQHLPPGVPEPDAKLTEIPKVPGTGRPEDVEVLRQRHRAGRQRRDGSRQGAADGDDPARKRRQRSRQPRHLPVFDLHRIFTPAADR